MTDGEARVQSLQAIAPKLPLFRIDENCFNALAVASITLGPSTECRVVIRYVNSKEFVFFDFGSRAERDAALREYVTAWRQAVGYAD